METRIMQYVVQQLAAAGFVIADPSVAFELRPDIFGFVRMNAGYAFNVPRADLVRYLRQQPRVNVIEVQFEGSAVWMLFGYRMPNPPLAHAELITGRRVTEVRDVADDKPQSTTKKPEDDGPPAHQCEARRQYFEALGIPDPVYPTPDRFPMSRRRF